MWCEIYLNTYIFLVLRIFVSTAFARDDEIPFSLRRPRDEMCTKLCQFSAMALLYFSSLSLVPLNWTCISSPIFLKSGLAATLGIFMWTEALTVVPKLVGQNVSHPSLSSREKGTLLSISFTPLTHRECTYLTKICTQTDIICLWFKLYTYYDITIHFTGSPEKVRNRKL